MFKLINYWHQTQSNPRLYLLIALNRCNILVRLLIFLLKVSGLIVVVAIVVFSVVVAVSLPGGPRFTNTMKNRI